MLPSSRLLLSKAPASSHLLRFATPAAAQARSLGVITSSGPGPKRSHMERSETAGRPMSPHVLIYAFPLAAIASITHRATGVALVVGVYGMGLHTLMNGDTAALTEAIGNSSIGGLAKICVTFPIAFHTLTGARHLYWERFPDNLNPTTQYQTSAAIFGVSGLVALGSALM